MKKGRVWISLIVLTVIFMAGMWLWLSARDTPPKSQPTIKTTKFKDKTTGVSFNLPEAYKANSITEPPSASSNKLIQHFSREHPQAFLSVRYEMGLAAPVNLLKRSVTEHIEADIRQFFPVRFNSYKSIKLQRITVAGKDAVEHEYSYTDKDQKPIKARLIAIPWTLDTAYYVILQSHTIHFSSILKDLDIIKNSFQAP